jgi:hypothetical protein
MNEQVSLERVFLTPQEQDAFKEVGAEALHTVNEMYGTGYPHFNGGHEGGLAYHNGHHTLAVARGSARVAGHLGLGAVEVATAEQAGAAHDIIQQKPRGVMERESADWYAERLRARGLPPVVIEAGSLAILGTEPTFDEQFRLTGQVVNQLEFPSRSAELVAKSVACADFSELYEPIGPYLGHRLYQQLKVTNPHETPPLDGLVGFQKNQVFLLNSYEYPHPAGEEVFGRLRGPVTEHAERMLRKLETGEIESWQQLLDHDLAFAARHA